MHLRRSKILELRALGYTIALMLGMWLIAVVQWQQW
jgi:hypothetical protein